MQASGQFEAKTVATATATQLCACAIFLSFLFFVPSWLPLLFFFLVWPLSTGRSKGDGPGDMVGDGREADWAHGTGRAGQRGGWVGGNEASGRSEKVEYEGSELRVDDELGHHIQGHG